MKKYAGSTHRGRSRKTSLAGLFSNLAASNVSATFLSAQITDLEERRGAIRRRINCKQRESPPARSARAA